MKTEMNKFGWFMNGAYVCAFVTTILLDKKFEVPFVLYLLLLLGVIINIIFQRKKIK